MNIFKRRISAAVVIALVVAASVIPTVCYFNYQSGEVAREAKQQSLRLAFIERYGTGAELIEIVKPENLYIYIWEMEGIRYFTLSINGLFVELGKVEVTE